MKTIVFLKSGELMNNKKLERIYELNLMICANFWWTVEKRVMAIVFCSWLMRFVEGHEKFWSVVRSSATTQQWTVDEDNVFDDDPFIPSTEQSSITHSTQPLIIQSFDNPFSFIANDHSQIGFASINPRLTTKKRL